jgi:hypothetical protein
MVPTAIANGHDVMPATEPACAVDHISAFDQQIEHHAGLTRVRRHDRLVGEKANATAVPRPRKAIFPYQHFLLIGNRPKKV